MKYIKKGKKVSLKVTLPKSFEFKLFGQLTKDLGFGGDNPEFVDNMDHIDVKDIEYATQIRDREKLRDATSMFSPRCMTDAGMLKEYEFFAKYQLHAFLKKYPEKGVDSKQAAIDKFVEAENVCRLFNNENYKALLSLDKCHPDFLGIVGEIQRDIEQLIGEYPRESVIMSQAKHGPGTSLDATLYEDGRTTSYFKWSNLPYTVTSPAVPFAKTAISSDPRWIGALDSWYRKKFSIPIGHPINMKSFWDSVLTEVSGSRLTTVPKSAEIDRCIAIEPLLNVYFQLGVDQVIRQRLRKRWGYDLNSQKLNQDMAYEGSLDTDYVTIDLSSASDLISLKICEILLPPAWYNLLTDLRSRSIGNAGEEIELHKISSMGNGFTFALESLIFGALARVAIRRTKSVRKSTVFGDDIIVPQSAYPFLKDLLQYSGFKINVEKTFDTGDFRESCGADFLRGTNVRPLFITSKIRNVKDLFYVHNALWRLEQDKPFYWGLDFSRTRALVRKYIPEHIKRQYYGPPSESLDTYLFSYRKIKREPNGSGKVWFIQPTAIKYNKGSKLFFFRKLMVSLRPSSRKNEWEIKDGLPDTGNAFDVTKRDKTRNISAWRTDWKSALQLKSLL